VIKKGLVLSASRAGAPVREGGRPRANGPVPIFTMHVTQRPGEADLFGRYNLTAYDEMFSSAGVPRAH